MERLVVIGNGMAGHRLVQALQDRGSRRSRRITVLGEEARPAYDRVALSSSVDGTTAEAATSPRDAATGPLPTATSPRDAGGSWGDVCPVARLTKESFSLLDGRCLDADGVSVPVCAVRVTDGRVQIGIP